LTFCQQHAFDRLHVGWGMNSSYNIMNIKLFKALVTQLLGTHYGIGIDDTNLGDDPVVADAIGEGERPFSVVNQYADEIGLVRTDNLGTSWGVFSSPLTEQDERKALQSVGPVVTIELDEVLCSTCGCRTEFLDAPDLAIGAQHHRCPNVACGHEFIAEHRSSMYADSIIRGKPENFKGLVIHGVIDRNPAGSPEGTAFEIVGKDDFPDLYSVYLIAAHTGRAACVEVEPVGDFGLVDQARAYAAELAGQYGWPVQDCTGAAARAVAPA
jgi:hypothetical protein